MRERFVIYAICFGILMGGSMIAFLLGVATNKDACFTVALVLFFMGLLLTVVRARTSKAARWLLAGLFGLILLMGVLYLWFVFQWIEASVRFRERMKELEMEKAKIEAVAVQPIADEPKPDDETAEPEEND